MALPWGTLPLKNKPAASSEGEIHCLRTFVKLVQVKVVRRSLLPLLVSTATLPQGNDSKKDLLQEYLKRSKENKARNDKERLDDYYKRNYKDYFELIEGSARDKKEELLSESERGIRAWLEKNKK
ncbi:uncharacterized protein LOC103707504 [Phoenix dactylifera]|uniref:Uncharacterized protein LOC103707504 n=1 Tax=Phoenix dactylifera TaxID=42345 RepID=A0A8B7C2D1_PHODC|nr:uncharacterized protein LOC103707504 [Phoenix dactylifera]